MDPLKLLNVPSSKHSWVLCSQPLASLLAPQTLDTSLGHHQGAASSPEDGRTLAVPPQRPPHPRCVGEPQPVLKWRFPLLPYVHRCHYSVCLGAEAMSVSPVPTFPPSPRAPTQAAGHPGWGWSPGRWGPPHPGFRGLGRCQEPPVASAPAEGGQVGRPEGLGPRQRRPLTWGIWGAAFQGKTGGGTHRMEGAGWGGGLFPAPRGPSSWQDLATRRADAGPRWVWGRRGGGWALT